MCIPVCGLKLSTLSTQMAGRCGRVGKVPGRPDDAVVILMCRGQNRRKIRFSEEELEGRFKDKVTRDFGPKVMLLL